MPTIKGEDVMKRWIVVGALVALPVVANAECAWVLWLERSHSRTTYPIATAHLPYDPSTSRMKTRDEKTWTIVGAWPAHGDCRVQQITKIDELVTAWRDETRNGDKVEHPDGSTLILRTRNYDAGEDRVSIFEHATYRCLPDTIDPRATGR